MPSTRARRSGKIVCEPIEAGIVSKIVKKHYPIELCHLTYALACKNMAGFASR
jgi:hypothetical protein